MSTEWVEKTAKEMADSKDPKTKALGEKLQAALDTKTPPVTGNVVESIDTTASGANEVAFPTDPVFPSGGAPPKDYRYN